MRRPLSPREGRLLALAILFALVALVEIAVVQPIVDGFVARAEARAGLLQRYRTNERLIAAIPRIGREAARRDARMGHYVLSTSDAGTAADALRDRIQTTTAAVGGDFHGADDIPAPVGKVAMRAALRLSAEQLEQLLPKLENGSPLITITALSVGADDALITGRATDLDVKIDAALAFRPVVTHPATAR